MSGKFKRVVVAGAGPVGLLSAYMLATQLDDIEVDIVEASDHIDEGPRALAYGPPAVKTLRKAGVLKDMLEIGFEMQKFSWRKLSGEVLANLDLTVEDPHRDDADIWVNCPVGTFTKFLYGLVQKLPNVSTHWQRKVVALEQDEASVLLTIEDTSRIGVTSNIRADFVIGADGASSGVRKALFDHNFPGYTWPVHVIAVNAYLQSDTTKDFAEAFWVLNPQDWCLIAKITEDGLWRIGMGENTALPLDPSGPEMKAHVSEKLTKILPTHPTADQFRITHISPYKIHQRMAPRMRVGRVLLAGDAAHLNNPMGGLGLTTGISDVGSLVECLVGIYHGKASMKILDKYDEVRREIFSTYVDPVSTANLKRVMSDPDESGWSDPMINALRQAKLDLPDSNPMPEMCIHHSMERYYDLISV